MKKFIKKGLNLILLSTITAAISSNSHAQTVLVCHPDSCSANDSYVFRNADDTSTQSLNYGTATELQAYAWTAGGHPVFTRMFLDFNDLQNIPVGATIVSATLRLHTPPSSVDVPQGDAGSNVCWVQRVTSAWNQSSVNWDNQPTVTTTDQTSLPASTSTWSYNVAVDVKTLTQDIINLPVAQRHGFGIRLQTEATYRCMLFGAAEYPDTSIRPELIVVYEFCTNSKLPVSRFAEASTLDYVDANTINSKPDVFPVAVSPNPSKGNIAVSYELPADGAATINLISLSTGKTLKTIQVDGAAGQHLQNVSFNDVVNNESVIVVQVIQGDKIVSKRVTAIK